MAEEKIKEFGEVRENEERRDGGCAFVFDPAIQKYAVGREVERDTLRLFSGGVDEGEDIQTGVKREVTEESGLHDFLYIEKITEAFTHYRNNLKNLNRIAHATCFLIILRSDDLVETHLQEHEKFYLTWATAEEMLENWKERNENHDYDHWIYFLEKAIGRAVELGYDTTSKI